MARSVLAGVLAAWSAPLSLVDQVPRAWARAACPLLAATVLGIVWAGALGPGSAPGKAVPESTASTGPAASVGSGAGPTGDAVALGRALTGAWNVGQVERVVALFAEDAVVRQAGVELTPFAVTAAVSADDVYGTAMFLPDFEPSRDEEGVVWATGRAEIRAWVAALVARRHVAEAWGFRSGGPPGDRARWEYRVFADPYWQFRDVPPTEGTAELRARAGEIVSLTLASTRESVRRRDAAMLQASIADLRRRHATRDSPRPPTAAPRQVPGQPDHRSEAGVGLPLVLVLAALGALAAGVIGVRRQRPPTAG